jgi:large subunit ribosomal protein L35
MPKLKTHNGAARRFKLTGTGKLMRTKGPKSHFRRNKAARVKRMLDRMVPADASLRDHIQRMLPYGA